MTKNGKQNGKEVLELLMEYSGQDNDPRAKIFMQGLFKALPKNQVMPYATVFDWMRGDSKFLAKSIDGVDFFFVQTYRKKFGDVSHLPKKWQYVSLSRVIAYSNITESILVNDWYVGRLPMCLKLFARTFYAGQIIPLEEFNELVDKNPIDFLHYFVDLTRPNYQAHLNNKPSVALYA